MSLSVEFPLPGLIYEVASGCAKWPGAASLGLLGTLPRLAITALSWRRPQPTEVAAGVALLVCLSAAVEGIAMLGPSPRWVLVGGIVTGLVLSHLVFGADKHGPLILSMQIVLFTLARMTMFALRPVATELVDDWIIASSATTLTNAIDPALVLALIAEAAYCVSFFDALAPEGARVLPASPRTFKVSTSGYVVGVGRCDRRACSATIFFLRVSDRKHVILRAVPSLTQHPRSTITDRIFRGSDDTSAFRRIFESLALYWSASSSLGRGRGFPSPGSGGAATPLWYFHRGVPPPGSGAVVFAGTLAFSRLR